MAEFEINSTSFSFRNLCSVMVRRKRTIIALYLFVIAVAGTYCFFWPPSYQATVRFIVKNDRQDPTLSSDQTAIKTQARSLITEEDLNTEADILRSSEVVTQAVVRTAVDKMPEHWAIRLLNAPVKAALRVYNDYHQKPSEDAVGAATGRVLRKLEVGAEKKSNVVAARLLWGDPRLSKSILEAIRDAYLEKHLAVHQSPQRQQFFQDQLSAKRAELEALDRMMARVRFGRSLPVVGEEERHAVRQTSDLESEWRKAAAQADQAAAKVAELEKQLASLPERVITEEKPVHNPIALGNLKAQIVELQRKQAELRTKYKDGNRLVQQNREELAATEAMLRSETETPVIDRTTSVNKVVERLKEELALARSEELAFRSLHSALQKEWESTTGGLTKLSREGTALRLLERDREVVLAAMQFYSKRLEEARATDAMDRMQLLNVTPIEAVQVDPMPVKPRIGLVLKLALSLGLLIAVGLAFLLELVNRRVHTRRELEEELNIPVLAEVLRWDHKKQRDYVA